MSELSKDEVPIGCHEADSVSVALADYGSEE